MKGVFPWIKNYRNCYEARAWQVQNPSQQPLFADPVVPVSDMHRSFGYAYHLKYRPVPDPTRLHNSPGLSYNVMQVVSYINSHIAEPIRVSDVADAVKLHPDYLTRLFKKDMNCSLSQYIIKEKCRAARYMLLNSQASCTEISSFLYFASCSHFVNCFKKEYGLTPNAYRKQMGGLSNDRSDAF